MYAKLVDGLMCGRCMTRVTPACLMMILMFSDGDLYDRYRVNEDVRDNVVEDDTKECAENGGCEGGMMNGDISHMKSSEDVSEPIDDYLSDDSCENDSEMIPYCKALVTELSQSGGQPTTKALAQSGHLITFEENSLNNTQKECLILFFNK